MISDSRSTFQFGEFALDVGAFQLRRRGRPVRLERQPMELLILLAERRQQLVTRSEIVQRLWGDGVFVDVETGINTAVRKIRQALGDSPEAPVFLETVPGKGYRFIASVDVISPVPEPSTIQEPVAAPVVAAPPTTEIPAVVRRRPAVMAIAGAVLLLLGGSAWVWQGSREPAPRIRVGVLPFDNMSEQPDRGYLADGLAEEITVSLGQAAPDHLDVIGRTSMLVYKRAAKPLAEIGAELGADYLIEGSIRAESERFRTTVRLVRVRDQVQVWSQSFDREATSLLAVQQELSVAVAEQIRSRLSPSGLDALARRQTRNAEAYDLYLRGLEFGNQRTPPTTRRALELFRQARTLDPGYALAWSAESRTVAGSLLNGDAPPSDVCPRAQDAATQALRAEPSLAEAHFAIGYVRWVCDWKWSETESELRRTITLDPSFAHAHSILGHALSQMGRHAEAMPLVARARELDPFYAMSHALSSQVAFQARDYATAIDDAQRAIAVGPEFWVDHMMLGQASVATGQMEQALKSLAEAERLSNHNSKPVSVRAYVLAKAGRTGEAREVLARLESTSAQRYVPPYALALIHAGLGETEQLFAELDRALTARDTHLMYVQVDSKWDPFRTDPRFDALIARAEFR